MGSGKQRPLLHAADLRFRRKLIRVAIVLGLLAVLLVWAEARYGSISGALGIETYKLVLQFFMITAGGGAFLAIVNNAQSVASRRQERAASVQALDRELDAAYRALKKVKRRLRAHFRINGGEPAYAGESGAGAERKIPQAIFEKAMDDLLDAQLRLETICDHIGQRDDILQPARLARMKGPLRYASRYYHDVYEDFEKGRVRLEDGHYALGDAFNLNDYLGETRGEAHWRSKALAYHLERLSSDSADLPARAKALDALIAESPDEPGFGGEWRTPGKLRFAEAATACFDLLSAELAEVRAKLLS